MTPTLPSMLHRHRRDAGGRRQRPPMIRNRLPRVVALVLGGVIAATGAAGNDAPAAGGLDPVRLWQDVTPKLEQALAHEEIHDSLPEDAWFGPDQTSNQASINELLDQAVAVLAAPGGKDYRAEIRALERAVGDAGTRIADLRRQRVTAPESALWSETTADIDDEIADWRERIAELRGEIDALKHAFAEELRGIGLDISDEQLEFLLSTVIGEDIIALGVAFDSVKAVTAQLEQLLVDSGEDLLAARRYYGMYALLLGALGRLHDTLLGEVRRYLGEIDRIEERAGSLLQQSRDLSRASERHRRTLAANIEAQKLTLQTAKLYRDYLTRQARGVAQSRQRLAQDIAVAQNTYETVKVSGDLVRMVHSGQTMLETLLSREAPVMFTFQNLEMKREFEKLTLKLREGESETR